jgi:hypothetical protein
VCVGDDAPDEVGLRGVQRRHQGVQLLRVERGDRLVAAPLLLLPLLRLLLLPALPGVVPGGRESGPPGDSPEQMVRQLVLAGLQEFHYSVVQGVLGKYISI